MSLDLSVHDRAVLNCIFNPSLSVTEAYDEEKIDELFDDESQYKNLTDLETVKKQEVAAVQAAEKGDYQIAVEILSECVKMLPVKSSIYNNRAQIYQFLGRFDDALDDLTEAIHLATKGNEKKTLRAALCQRGLLHRKCERNECAREDYQRAANLGSAFAKTQLVEINPYAALCNQMLQQVMQELK